MSNKNKKYCYNDVKEYIESFDYKLLSKEYINNKSKLIIMCDKGHIFEMSFSNFKNKKYSTLFMKDNEGQTELIKTLSDNYEAKIIRVNTNII